MSAPRKVRLDLNTPALSKARFMGILAVVMAPCFAD